MSRPIRPYYKEDGITLYNGECFDVMQSSIQSDSIDLTVTSPPYDGLRTYNGYSFDFETIAQELWRVTKQGGVVVWVVGDSTVNGSESGTSFRQALHFKELGFNLHDTMIYWKNSFAFPESNRYANIFEYMFIFTKGAPKTSNIFKIPTNKENRIKSKSSSFRNSDGTVTAMKYEIGKDERNKENIWIYETGYSKTTKDNYAFQHPAMFPEQLAHDHIISWSNKGDLVFDPFSGSGTTGKMAKYLHRKFIGIDVSEEYCTIAKKRIENLNLGMGF